MTMVHGSTLLGDVVEVAIDQRGRWSEGRWGKEYSMEVAHEEVYYAGPTWERRSADLDQCVVDVHHGNRALNTHWDGSPAHVECLRMPTLVYCWILHAEGEDRVVLGDASFPVHVSPWEVEGADERQEESVAASVRPHYHTCRCTHRVKR